MQMKIFIHHMVAKCNNNSNGTKIKNTMRIYYQCQCNNGILQPEPRKVKATKFAHEISCGDARVQRWAVCSWTALDTVSQSLTISDVLNSIINRRLITKSYDWISVLFRGHASGPYNKTGMHWLFMSCRVTSSEAILPVFAQNAMQLFCRFVFINYGLLMRECIVYASGRRRFNIDAKYIVSVIVLKKNYFVDICCCYYFVRSLFIYLFIIKSYKKYKSTKLCK